MFKRLIRATVLATASLSSCLVFSAPPVVQSQADAVNKTNQTQVETTKNVASEQALSEMLFQMQQMQQELMTLRGMVEELSFDLQQAKQQSKDRYVDLDRRISELRAGTAAVGTGSGAATPDSGATGVVVSDNEAEQQQYDQAKDLIRQKKYDEAVAAFSKYISDYPNSAYTANAWYWMGEVSLVMRDTEKAKNAFQAVVDQFPDHQKYPDSLYKLATCYAKLGDNAKAKELFEKVVNGYPGSQIAGKASLSLKNLN